MPGVQFTHPWALLLLALLAPAVHLARHSLAGLGYRRARLALVLRLLLVTTLVLALAGTQTVRRVQGTCVVYVLDRSESVPEPARAAALSFVTAAGETMRADDTAGVVVTAREALVEKTPLARLRIERVESRPDPGFTDLAAGLRLAVATLRPDAQRRVVLLSDGNENLGDLGAEARLAGALGVPVDVFPLRRQPAAEVLAERLLIPAEARSGEVVVPRVVVHADQPTTAVLRLLRDNVLVVETTTRLAVGKNVVALPAIELTEDGFHRFTAELAPAQDGDRRNNRALGFTHVRGRQRVLYIEGDRGHERYLAGALRRGGIRVDSFSPAGLPTDLATLAGYDCLILSNVSALDLSEAQMVMVRSAVRDLGIGLVMIGGDESFGVGGFYRTPIEEALPVDMDIRKQRHLPNVGVAIVIDKSGSMAMTEAGIEKIQLANEAAIAVISLLGPEDRVAVIATDSVAKEVTPGGMVPVADKQALIDPVAAIRAGGGGIYVYNGLKKAGELLRDAPVKIKHIILFADAADSEQQENCRELVRQLVRERITLTTVALGHETDCDVPFLKDITKLGLGRFYLTARASNLPRIFTREAILASRSQIVEKTFTPLLGRDLEPLKGIDALPPLRGYVATTAKPSAEVGLLADQRYKDPILAVWQYGLGRAVAFTSDCKARWAAHWLGWSGYGKFWTQTVRYAMRRVQTGEFETRVVTPFGADPEDIAAHRLRPGEGRVVIDAVDDRGRFVNFLALHGTAVLPDGSGVELAIRQVAPGRYEATFPADQVGLYLVNVGVRPRAGRAAAAQTVGMALAYPPEYRDVRSNDALLARVAETTGGSVLERPEQVFGRRGADARAPSDVWGVLLAFALALLPLDIAVRRLVVDPRRALASWLAGRMPRQAPEPERATGQLLDRKRSLWEQRRAAAAAPPTPLSGTEREPEETTVEVTGEAAVLSQRLREARAARRARTPVTPTPPPAPPAVPPSPAAAPAPTPPAERDVAGSLARLRRAQRRWRGHSDEPNDAP